ADAVANIVASIAGQRGRALRGEIDTHDLVLPRSGHVKNVAIGGHCMRRIDRDTQSGTLRLNVAVGRPAGAEHRIDFARVEPDPAHAMIATVGDVQATLAEGKTLRQLETARRRLSIPIPGRART